MKLFGILFLLLNISMGVRADCPPDAVMDLVFLVDTSSSIRKAGAEAIDSIRSFIHAVVNGFTVGPDHTQFGAISYNRNPKMEFMLGEFNTGEETLRAIDAISFEEGRGTETGKAIHFMSDQLSNSTINNFGARSNSKIVAVVITDGRSNDFPLVGTGQEELKKIVDVVIAVGVNMKKENELSKEIKLIASDPDEHYAVEATSFDALEKIKDMVKDCICMGISQQHCFMPVHPVHPMMDADDAGFPMLSGRSLGRELIPASGSELASRPHQNGGRQRPISGGYVSSNPDPIRTQVDACCGQTTYNTGMKKCCAFGKADSDKKLVEIDTTCPQGSYEIDWQTMGVQMAMSNMDMMGMMGMDHGDNMDHLDMGMFNLMEPIQA